MAYHVISFDDRLVAIFTNDLTFFVLSFVLQDREKLPPF
jgi:hypothetical protein